MFAQTKIYTAIWALVLVSVGLLWCASADKSFGLAFASPASTVNLFAPSSGSKFSNSNKQQQLFAGDDHHHQRLDTAASEEFKQFIQTSSKDPQDSTLIGEIRPNSSVQEINVLRDKIASTILKIQEMERAKQEATLEAPAADCFIELTRLEKVPGKCQRASGGIPICQSDLYMSISKECS